MDITQIEAFERVAREGTFTRAAETLDLTQPAVSMRVTALEKELGGKLFERRGRGLQLTPLGECFGGAGVRYAVDVTLGIAIKTFL
jgi:DNA-binding transcriptional LysR family regulator